MESQLNDMCYKIYILKTLSKHISDAITVHAILLVLPDSYSTFCTILNSTPATIGSFSLSTNTVITQVLTKNVRHSSHWSESPQNGLGDEQTCRMTLASAYVLHCLSAT